MVIYFLLCAPFSRLNFYNGETILIGRRVGDEGEKVKKHFLFPSSPQPLSGFVSFFDYNFRPERGVKRVISVPFF